MQATGADEIARRVNTDGVQAAVGGSLELLLGRVAKNLDRDRERKDRLFQLVNVVPIIGALNGSGTLDYPDRYGPTDGFTWDVRRISADGFTAGTVNLYKNDATGAGVRVASWSTPGTWTWSGQLWLRARDRLVFIATGIAGNVQIDGNAHLVAESLVPEYIL